jgi:pimeloyl-ACP methyl ester carboxylesterase
MTSRTSSSLNGTRYSWFEAGSGEAVVLVHGIGSDARAWADQYKRFAHDYHVIGLDLPGYGDSAQLPADAPSSSDYAERVREFLAGKNIQRAHFVGHSMGSIILCDLLRTWSGHVLSLTLLQPVRGFLHLEPAAREGIRHARTEDVHRLGMRAFAKQRGRAVLGPTASEATADRHLSIMTEIPERAYLQAWEMMCQTDLFTLLLSISCRTQVIAGTEDKVAPEAVCAEIAHRIGATHFVRLADVGHSASLEAPDRLADALAAFIGEFTE